MQDIHDQATCKLLNIIPATELDRVLNSELCDIGTDFLGFVDTYFRLADIIPLEYTVIDLGCAYNPQSYFFKDHARYIAVDNSDCEKFKPENCELVNQSIYDFINDRLIDFNLDTSFAICNFVPPWGHDNQLLTRTHFKNCYCYYPSRVKSDFILDNFKKT